MVDPVMGRCIHRRSAAPDLRSPVPRRPVGFGRRWWWAVAVGAGLACALGAGPVAPAVRPAAGHAGEYVRGEDESAFARLREPVASRLRQDPSSRAPVAAVMPTAGTCSPAGPAGAVPSAEHGSTPRPASEVLRVRGPPTTA
jgi:hypothetical protein